MCNCELMNLPEAGLEDWVGSYAMKKCGMKYEGTMRSADRNNQGICDASMYARLRSERRE